MVFLSAQSSFDLIRKSSPDRHTQQSGARARECNTRHKLDGKNVSSSVSSSTSIFIGISFPINNSSLSLEWNMLAMDGVSSGVMDLCFQFTLSPPTTKRMIPDTKNIFSDFRRVSRSDFFICPFLVSLGTNHRERKSNQAFWFNIQAC